MGALVRNREGVAKGKVKKIIKEKEKIEYLQKINCKNNLMDSLVKILLYPLFCA